MMDTTIIEELIANGFGDPIHLFMKGSVLVGLSIYVVFAFVVIRQVQLMTKTLEVGFEAPIRFIAWLHLLFALGTTLLALVIL